MHTPQFSFKKFLTQVTAVLMIVMLMLTLVTPAFAATSGPNNATAGANVNGPGTVNWTNPGNVVSDNNVYVTAAVNGTTTEYLQATGYGFAIPAAATIDGITVTIGRFGSTGGGSDVRDSVVSLVKGGVITGSNFAVTGTDWPGGEAAATYGGTANLWGTTWLPADINAPNFGVVLSVTSANSRTASVDYIQVTITYTLPVAPTITSANATTFTVGSTANTFTVTATGSPAPTFSVTAGTLPSGVTLNATTGVLNGAPVSGTVGSYPITITASNGVLPNATQNFTLTVAKANTTLAITSDNPDPSLVGQNVTVNFSITSANNTITPTGLVTVSDGVNSCTGTVAGAASPFTGSCVVALTTAGARTLTASYAGDANFNAPANATAGHTVTTTYTITLTTGAGGTIQSPYGTVVTGSVSVASGSNITFYFVPNANNIVSGVIQDSNPIGRVNAFTFNNVTAPHTLSVSFDSGWYAPTGNVNSTWTNAGNGYTSSNTWATANNFSSQIIDYTNFGIPAIPAGSTIDGIEVAMEGFTGGRQATASLSGNAGGSFTSNQATNFTAGAAEETAVLGGPTDLWGVAWPVANFTNANFRVRVSSVSGGLTTFSLDQIQVKVHYRQPTTLTVGTATGVYGGTTTLTAHLATTVGNTPVSGQTITFFLNGNPATPIGSALTDVNGDATLNNVDLSGINVGVYAGTFNTSGVGASYAGTTAGALPGYLGSNGANTLTVTKATLTVTANDKTREYGAVDPVFNATITGFVNGETLATSDVTGSPSCTTAAVVASPIGDYPINCAIGTLASANYNFTFVPGTLTITPADLLITASSDTMVYGGAVPAITPIYTGLRAGDTVPATPPTCSTTATSTSPVGPYPSTCSGAVDTNYNITYAAGNVDVTKAVLTVTANDKSRIYGDPNPPLDATITGFVNGDTLADISGAPSCTTTAVPSSPVSGSPYPITCAIGTLSATNYSFSFVAGDLTITSADLLITASSGTMTYGGAVPAITPIYTGLKAGDTAPATPPACSTTATSNSPVGPYPSTCSGAADPNYNITYAPGTITINQASLLITASDDTMVYGGTVPTITPIYTGLQAGDTAPATPPTCSTTATSASPVGSYPSTCSGAADPNYSITYAAGSVSVTPATATVSVTGGTFTYDGNPHGATGFAYGVGGIGDVLTPAVVFSYVGTGTTTYGPTAVAPTNVGTYDVTASFAGNANYGSAAGTATITINAAGATVSVTGGTFVFDDNPHGATGFAYGVGGVSDVLTPAVTFSYVGTGATTYGPTAVAPTNVGTYDATASFAGNANYGPASNTATITITPAAATVSVTGGTFVFDDNPHPATGFAYGVGGVSDVLTPAVTFSYVGTGATTYGPTAVAPTNVGTYDVTASFAGNANYSPASNTATITITPATATVSVTGGTFVFDGNPHAATGFAYGVGGISDVLTPAVTFSYVGTGSTIYGPTAVAPTNVGTYDVTASFAGNANYSSASDTAAITITPAAATVSVTGGTFTFDGNPHGATGFAYGVGGIADVLTPAVTFSYSGSGYGPTATPPTDVGTYTVTASFAGNANYSPASDTATIIINPVGVTVSVTGGTFQYDATPHAASGFAYGVGGPSDVQTPAVTFSYAGTGATVYGPTAVAPTNAGTYQVTASFAGNVNYSPASNVAALTITSRPIEVTAVTSTKAYDGNTSSSGIPTITSGTLVGTDAFTFSQTFNNKNVGTGKTLTPLAVISVGNANNYNITYVNDTTGEITGIPLTISGVTANSRVYDGTTDATLNTGTAALVGVLGGDVVTLNSGGATGSFADKNVGPLKAVTVTGFTISGADAGNYILNQPTGLQANITVRPITVTAQTNTKVYDSTTASAAVPTITAGSLAAGDTASFTQTYDTANVGTSKILTPSGAVNDGNLGGNYSVTFANNGTGVITARPLTITANPQAKGLGAPDPALTYSISSGSLAGSDTLSGSLTRVPGETAGVYAILQGSLTAGPNYNITYVGANLTIAVGAQTITVITSAPATAAYNTNFNVVATASSGLPVTITTTGGACSGGGVNGSATIVMISGTGTCTVHYNQAGDANFIAAPEILQNTTAQKANQTINVNTPAPVNATYNTGFNVAATATSGLPVAYSATGVCTNVGSNFTMTSGTGACTVQYDQAGDANYNAAPQVTQTTNAQKAGQTISVTTSAPAGAVYNSNFTVAATSSSGLPVAYSAAGSCNNAGATYTMTGSTGTCTVQFNQAGNANYNAAPQVTQTVNAQKANQTITVTTSAPASAAIGSNFTVAATASSGLPVAYSAAGSCSNVGATFTVNSSGSCTVFYNQAGDANYNAAPQIAEFANSSLAPQTINVTTPAPANAAFGSNFTVAATASSGLPVAYSSVGACTNVGATFTMTASTGTCTVQYNQAGNGTFSPAPQVINTVNAQSANQTITVTTAAPANAAFGNSFTVAATASSGLPVAYSATGICTNVGANFTMTSGAGTCVVHYNQAGNANYNAAPEVTANVNGQPANQTISVTTSAPASALNGTSFTVAATSSSGLPVTYSATGVCTNVGPTFTMNSSVGTCTVRYNQAGSANYNAAPQVTEDVSPFAAPNTTLTTTPPNPDNNTTPSFSFTSNDPTATFQCRVDGGAYSACNSGATFGPLAAGNHTFDVRAVDTLGNPDPTPASYSWTIDTAAPNTTINSNPPAVTNSASADFTFSSAATDLAGYQCQLDGGGYASCTSPRSYTSLSAGSHTFDVRAVDTSGNVDPSPASYTWFVDLAYPTVLFNGNTRPANNSTMTQGPTQFSIAFSKDVKNDGSAGAANLTANYILVEDGANGTFDTLSCSGGLVADDVVIPMTIPNYTNNGGAGPFIATSIVNGGTRLPDGTYRIYVCGTTSVEDLAGNKLNNGLSDTTITFTVDRNSGNNGGGGGGGNNGNGNNGGNTASSTAGLLIPVTGFAQGKITDLPAQPADKAYAATDVWMEIPKLGVKMSIVGIPQTKTGWDISWLGKNAGWLNGSAFPTWKGNSVITAHVWDAMNKPGPFVGLVNLTYGDQIIVHAFGQVFTYEVTESKVILPSNTAAAFKHEEKSWLTLITCENYQDKTETYSNRRIVRAVLVSVAKEK